MERSITMQAAWDKRHEDPKQNYGVHGVEIIFVVKGDVGAIQWHLMTSWVLPKTQHWWNEMHGRPNLPDLDKAPHMADYTLPPVCGTVTFHRKVDNGGQDCHLVGRCAPEQRGSIMRNDLWLALVEGGSDAVFAALETEYADAAKAHTH